MSGWHDARGSDIPWADLTVCVAGLGVSGSAAARVLERLGARVIVADAKLGTETSADVGDLVVTSPGWRPTHPLLVDASERGIPVWGEVELASRFATQPWLGVTGTNGKTTTTEMLAAILKADGRNVVAAGNIGTPLIEVVTSEDPPDVIAVELSSFQLHWTVSLQLAGAALLNIAPDHLDWHGGFAQYEEAKQKALLAVVAGGTRVAAFDLAGPYVRVRLDEPSLGELGVVGGVLTDRAFSDGSAICAVDDMPARGPHNVLNALAAAALALGFDAGTEAVGAALRSFVPGHHRLEFVATVAGVDYVNDSKATNPHAATQALNSFDRVVWIAGGLNKGLSFDDLVAGARERLVAAVLIGSCAGELRDALARHAPEVPVIDSADLHTAVEAARAQARAGDVVLLAPAAASMDMFRDYAHRGDEFAAAVHELEETP